MTTHRTTVLADHHKSVFVCQVLDHETGEVKKATLESRRDVLRPFLDDLPDSKQVFIEACRSWEWVSDVCEDVGVEFHLIDPRQMPEIAHSTKKSDQVDVEAMVRRFMVEGGLPSSYNATRPERELRAITREMSALRSDRRVVLQKIHAAIDAQGAPAKKTEFVKEEWRSEMQQGLSETTWFVLNSLLQRLDFIDAQRNLFDKKVKELTAKNELFHRLQAIPGIGPVIAATILAEAPHAKAFKTARQFAAYAGVVPSVRSSAGKARHGRITKSGPRDLRWALCQAVIVGQRSKEPSEAVKMYRRKKAKGKPWKVSLCAGANKLARIVWAILARDEEYRPVEQAA